MAEQTGTISRQSGGGPALETTTDRRAQFAALLHGDRTQPFLTSAWQHPVGEEYDPDRFAAATVAFNRTWDWDWVKINPRAVYYSEAWGAVYDPDDYTGVVPRLVSAAIAGVTDLGKISRLEVRANPVFAEHLASARLIREQLGDRAVLQTLFSPLSVLLQLAGRPLYPGATVPGAYNTITTADLLRRDPAATHAALAAIADTLAEYVAALVTPAADGGLDLDGIFYAVTGTASSGYFDQRSFDEFSRPYDLRVLAAASDALVVLHTCGPNSNPQWFDDYPIDALQWDQFQAGNPGLDADLSATAVGGVNRDLFAVGGDQADVANQLEATLTSASGRPLLLAPSCTVPTPADPASLRQLRDAT